MRGDAKDAKVNTFQLLPLALLPCGHVFAAVASGRFDSLPPTWYCDLVQRIKI